MQTWRHRKVSTYEYCPDAKHLPISRVRTQYFKMEYIQVCWTDMEWRAYITNLWRKSPQGWPFLRKLDWTKPGIWIFLLVVIARSIKIYSGEQCRWAYRWRRTNHVLLSSVPGRHSTLNKDEYIFENEKRYERMRIRVQCHNSSDLVFITRKQNDVISRYMKI